jgi:uncharacterized protein involved in propanediol utilization
MELAFQADNNAVLSVGVHNCLNRTIKGTLRVKSPEEITLASSTADIVLAAGETKTLVFPIASASPQDSNAYPFEFVFTSDAGEADYKEFSTVR